LTLNKSVKGYLPGDKDVSTEDEESLLVGSVTKQRQWESVTDRGHWCVYVQQRTIKYSYEVVC
jgi:hypothetical protein